MQHKFSISLSSFFIFFLPFTKLFFRAGRCSVLYSEPNTTNIHFPNTAVVGLFFIYTWTAVANSLMGKCFSPVASGSLSLPTDLASKTNGDNKNAQISMPFLLTWKHFDMRHLFTDLQCERSKSRWREPGVIPVIHKLLFQCSQGLMS